MELRSRDAVLHRHFGGAGLEEGRWQILAASLPFDAQAWPVPPGARAAFATPVQLEAELRARIAGEPPQTPLAVYEAKSPIDIGALESLGSGSRVQFSVTLGEAGLARLAAFLQNRPDVELRVHGAWRQGFDARTLARFSAVRSLVLDARRVLHADALAALNDLRTLRVGPAAEPFSLRAARDLPRLSGIALAGPAADVETLRRLPALESIRLIDTPPVRLRGLASAARIRSLTLAHAAGDLDEVRFLPALDRLELQSLVLERLPDLSHNANLHSLLLRDVRGVRDLAPICSAPALRELVIEAMPQLEVGDFRALAACERLLGLWVEIGSKTKSREVYRMLRPGRSR